MVGTSVGFAFIQAKHHLDLETGADSDLASVLDQFVRQFTACRAGSGQKPWDQPLNPDADRLVLATGPHSSRPITQSAEQSPAPFFNLTGWLSSYRITSNAS